MDIFTKTKWVPVLLYVLLAFGISALFKFNIVELPVLLASVANETVLSYAQGWAIGLGPIIAAILIWGMFGQTRGGSSLMGNWSIGSLLIFATPIAVLAGFGLENEFGFTPHVYGAIIGAFIVSYAFCEEVGWRGFMNDNMAGHFILRGLIIGVIWWAWHFTWTSELATVQNQLPMVAIFSALGILFTKIADQLKSWMALAGFHSFGNIAFLTSIIDASAQQRLIMGGTALAIMIALQLIWKRAAGYND